LFHRLIVVGLSIPIATAICHRYTTTTPSDPDPTAYRYCRPDITYVRGRGRRLLQLIDSLSLEPNDTRLLAFEDLHDTILSRDIARSPWLVLDILVITRYFGQFWHGNIAVTIGPSLVPLRPVSIDFETQPKQR
jgi:hypothetical protein